MNKHLGWTLAATALTFGLGSPAARADVAAASASFANMQILLFDLVPQDGIAPSVTFAAPAGLGSSAKSDMSWGSVATTSGTPFGGVLSINLTDPSQGGTASVYGDPFGAGLAMFANAYGNSSFTAHGGSEATLGDGEYGSAAFTLSPGTLMVISGHASESASISSLGANSNDYVFGSVQLILYSTDPNAPQMSNASSSAQANQWNTSGSSSADLTLSFVNLSNAAAAGAFWASSSAEANLSSSPIPEPASGSLLLSGLVGLGLLARRKTVR